MNFMEPVQELFSADAVIADVSSMLLRKKFAFLIVLGVALILTGLTSQSAELTVHLDQPGPTVSPTLYGLFFEDINRA